MSGLEGRLFPSVLLLLVSRRLTVLSSFLSGVSVLRSEVGSDQPLQKVDPGFYRAPSGPSEMSETESKILYVFRLAQQ